MQSILENLDRKRDFSINAKANIALTTITNKKKSPPIIKLRNILNGEIKLTEDNPKVRLSVDDYNLMYKNRILRKMMARTLDTDIKSLTAYYKKNVKELENHIDLSLMTIKEKEKAKSLPIKDLSPELLNGKKEEPLKLHHLPEDILKYITHNSLKSLFKYKYKMVKYKLVDGIPPLKLYLDRLVKNENALYYLLVNNIKINYFWISYNTNPIAMGLLEEEMKVNPDIHVYWSELSRNPKAIKILKANRNLISWGILSENTNPKAMKLIEEEIKVNPTHIKFESLAENETPEAMKLIEDNLLIENSIYNNINWNRFWEILSRNSKAVKILKANREKIDWCSLCGNQSTEAIKLLEEEMATKPDVVNWIILSGNPNQRAFAMLEANPTKINIRRLSGNTNPKAIELLEIRMEVENNLSEATYDSISTCDKIDWNLVSSNPKAIELLKKRIIYEDNLPEHRRRRLKVEELINWSELSANPSIFTIE